MDWLTAKMHRKACLWGQWIAVVAAALLLVSLGGCYEKRLAPEVEYSAEDVQILRDEIDKMEWD